MYQQEDNFILFSLLLFLQKTQTIIIISYRNQSIDLQNKLIDWFLYKGNTGHCI